MKSKVLKTVKTNDRRYFVGGSDARIIMGGDEAALLRLWQEKRGEAEPEDLSGNLIVQLGNVTEDLNRRWFDTNTGHEVVDVQRHVRHPALHWMGATLDGRVEASGAVFEAKFMLPWSFSEEAALRSMRRNCNTTCGWWPPGLLCSRLLPVAASGLRLGPMLIRSISTSLSPPSGNFGAVSRAASPLPFSALIPRNLVSRQFGLSI